MESLNPRLCGVEVMSWSMNCPHCITIIVNVFVSASEFVWIALLTARALGSRSLPCRAATGVRNSPVSTAPTVSLNRETERERFKVR